MAVGISFSIRAADVPELRSLPPPSGERALSSIDGKNKTRQIFYHIQYPPQSWHEWQRLAAIKVQIAAVIPGVIFDEYVPVGAIGIAYTVMELGKHFCEFVRWPKPLFPSAAGEQYKMLCRHAKRLHYEDMLHLEQLIATSIRFNEGMQDITVHPKRGKQGMQQVLNLAKAAYYFALDHRNEWQQKLSEKELHKALSDAAKKSAKVKRDKSAAKRREAAKMKAAGEKISTITDRLGVSPATVKRWLKNA